MKICFDTVNTRLQNNYRQNFSSKNKVQNYACEDYHSSADILAAKNFAFLGRKGCPVYAVSKDGKYQKFNSRKEAADALDISSQAISNCLAASHNTAGGFSFIEAEDAEIQNEDGTTEIDVKKIKEHVKKINRMSVYSIDKNGSYKKYNSKTEAAKEIGGLPFSFSKYPGGILKKSNVCVVRAGDFEVENEDGTTGINKDVLQECVEYLGYTTVYFIKQDGSYEKYDSQTKAANKAGVSASAVSSAINKNYKIKEMVVKRGCDIESLDENGKVHPDEDKIKEALKTFEN